MNCPNCGGRALVQETRKDEVQTIRAYRCHCGYRFYTQELAIDSEVGGKMMYAIKAHRRKKEDV